MKDLVYLDYAATAPLLPEAREAMLAVYDGDYGNASSLHGLGTAARETVEAARNEVARLINADPKEIIFTSGGSEANNMVMEEFRDKKVAVSAIEHPSVLEAAKARAREVVLLEVDEWGRLKLDGLEKSIQGCELVSVMLANNELGTIEPIKEVVTCCKKHNIKIHTDATQAFGKVKINVDDLEVDYLTISAHKIGGPIGTGALYARGGKVKPLIYGGHQEGRRRAGTTNTALIAGFGAAAKWCWDNWSCRKWEKVAELREKLCRQILDEVPHSSRNSPNKDCLPNILNMSFRAAEGESVQLYLDAEGIIVGTGSACAAGDLSPSHVIMATKRDAEIAHNSIRFSLGLDTTASDIERVMVVLPSVVRRLQGISTVRIEEEHD